MPPVRQRGEGTPEVHCTDPGRADCIGLALGRLWGPGTYRLPQAWGSPAASRYVFDVPEGWVLYVRPLLPPGSVEVTPVGAFGPVPLPLRRLPEWDGSRAVPMLASESLGSAVLWIDARTGEELHRSIVTTRHPREEILEFPTVRFVLDLRTFETTDRFPLDRASIMPPVDLIFARTEADLLFDEIMASLRIRE